MDEFSKMESTKSYSAGSTATVTPLLTRPKTVRSVSAKAFDTFRSGPERMIAPAISEDGRHFNAKAAAYNTANTPLVRRLKGRHLQMIAIGGSIGNTHIRGNKRSRG
jgi:yeast amino acid transporter